MHTAKLRDVPAEGWLLQFQIHIVGFGYKEEVFYSKRGEALAAQRGGRSPVLGDIQGQAGWSSKHCNLAADDPVHCRSIELDDF